MVSHCPVSVNRVRLRFVIFMCCRPPRSTPRCIEFLRSFRDDRAKHERSRHTFVTVVFQGGCCCVDEGDVMEGVVVCAVDLRDEESFRLFKWCMDAYILCTRNSRSGTPRSVRERTASPSSADVDFPVASPACVQNASMILPQVPGHAKVSCVCARMLSK